MIARRLLKKFWQSQEAGWVRRRRRRTLSPPRNSRRGKIPGGGDTQPPFLFARLLETRKCFFRTAAASIGW